MKTILVPVDFSLTTDRVVAEASTLARALQARIIFVTAVQPPNLAQYGNIVDAKEILRIAEETTSNYLQELKDAVAAKGISVETIRLDGPPVQAIIKKAERLKPDLIVMGSHGHTALFDLLVGSTTHGVLKRAHCPVVVVPSTNETK